MILSSNQKQSLDAGEAISLYLPHRRKVIAGGQIRMDGVNLDVLYVESGYSSLTRLRHVRVRKAV